MSNDTTTCNVCCKQMKWESESTLEDSAGEYMAQFTNRWKHIKKGKAELKRATKDLMDHCKSHKGKIRHCYALPTIFVAAKKGCWPFELKVVDVAQEILWEEFHAAGGIPRIMCELAVQDREDSLVRARFLKILGAAIGTVRNPSDRFFKRLHGAGTVVPSGYPADEYVAENVVADSNKAGKKDFFKKVENELERVYECMSTFPFVTFLFCFQGEDKERIGYGWNSLCLFFVSGLYDHVYFPWMPKQMVSNSTLMDFDLQNYQGMRTKRSTDDTESSE